MGTLSKSKTSKKLSSKLAILVTNLYQALVWSQIVLSLYLRLSLPLSLSLSNTHTHTHIHTHTHTCAGPDEKPQWILHASWHMSKLWLCNWGEPHTYLYSPDEFSVAPVVIESCWLFSCRQLDSKETNLADVSTLVLRRTWASSWNIGKKSFFAIKLFTREQSATFYVLLYRILPCNYILH